MTKEKLEILLVEDELVLVSAAEEILIQNGYDVRWIRPQDALQGEVWKGTAKPNVLAVIDLYYTGSEAAQIESSELKFAVTLEGSGEDILYMFDEERREDLSYGANKVIIATSLDHIVEPKTIAPFIARVETYDIYGYKKGKGPDGSVNSSNYARGLLETIRQVERGELKPLNLRKI